MSDVRRAPSLVTAPRSDALGTWASQQVQDRCRSVASSYGLSAVAVAAAIGIRAAMDPIVQDQLPFATLFGALAVAVWIGGPGPAIAAAIVGYFVADWLFIAPRHVLRFSTADLGNLTLYGIGAGLLIALGVRTRRAEARARVNAQAAEENAGEARLALEERRRAEELARELDERLRVAIKNSRFMLAQADRDLRYTWVHNPHPDFAVPAEPGRRSDETGTSDAARRLVALARQVIETGNGLEADLSFPSASGVRSYAFTIEPLRAAEGGIVGVTTAALDITDRKRAEDALRLSEERARQQFAELAAIYRTAPLGFAVLDRDLRFRRVNDRFAQINGVPARDHIGRTVGEIVPSFAQQARQMLLRVLESGQPVRTEFRGETKADPGVERVWDQQWYPLHNGEGQVAGIGLIVEEVTEIRRSEHALRESEELFRALAENVPQLTWMARADGWIFWYNRRWFDYTGTGLEQVLGWGWQTVHHPEHLDRVLRSYRHALETGTPWEETFPLRGHDGQYRWFLTRAFPIHDASGKITRWFGSNTDVHVLRETQLALRDAQSQVRQYAEALERTVAERTAKLTETVHELEAFSYSIAHDMRAPLRSMIGYSDLVREEYADALDDTGCDYLKRISASARRLDHLIQDVLDYSRVVRESLPLEPVDVGELAEDVIDSYPHLSAVKGCIEVAREIPPLVANPAALTQVLSNLLGNAVKFVPPGTTPCVRVFAEPAEGPRERPGAATRWVRVVVSDNGIGIESSVRPRLFQMFQRFTRPGLYEGTGMGLAIARKAVDRMGGLIGVDSEPGSGSRFWFVLPAAPRDAAPGNKLP